MFITECHPVATWLAISISLYHSEISFVVACGVEEW